MDLDHMMKEVLKLKINEVFEIMKDGGFSNGQILEVLKTASGEIEEDLKTEMWSVVVSDNFK